MPPLVHYFFFYIIKEIRTVILGNTFVFMVYLLSFLKENGVTKKGYSTKSLENKSRKLPKIPHILSIP